MSSGERCGVGLVGGTAGDAGVVRRVAVWLTHDDVECWNFRPRHQRALEAALPGVSVDVVADEPGLVRALGAGADTALVWRFRQDWFAHAPRLRRIVTPAAGRDYFDVVPPSGVELVYSHFHGELIAETVLGMLLGLCRGVVDAAGLQAGAGFWPRGELSASMRNFRGSHVVILGFGNIGCWVGRLCKPLGVRITGLCRNPCNRPDYFGADDAVLPMAKLEESLGAADFLVMSLPGGVETDNLMDAKRLALLPSHAVLVNVGRGNALDEVALVGALRAGRLGAAFLDVFRAEPLPADSILRGCPRLYWSPHSSAIAPNYLDLFVRDTIKALQHCH